MKLAYTRAMVNAAVNGQLRDVETIKHDIFNVEMPVAIHGVPSDVLNPRDTWSDPARYDVEAKALAMKFKENFTRFTKANESVIAAGPLVI